MKRTLFLVGLVLGTAGCGSKTATTAPATPVAATHSAEHQEDHGKMPPEIVQFHDVLSPRWHAEVGPERMKDTCAALPAFQTSADALVKSPMPAGAEASKWTTGTTQLVDAVAALKVTCDKPDAATFEPAFKHVHETFHIVAESLGHTEHHSPAMGEHAGAH